MNRLCKFKKDEYFLMKIFFAAIVLTAAFAVFRGFITNGRSNQWFLFADTNDAFMDFFNSVYDASFKNPYSQRGVIYPPLSYCIYKIFVSLIPSYAFLPGSFALRNFSYAAIYYFIFSLIQFAVFVKLIAKLYDKGNKQNKMLCVCVSLSAPILFCIDRGNLILLSLICVLWFFLFKDSKNKYLCESSLILLAVAANLKIYPAVFGLILLGDGFKNNTKNLKKLCRLIIYGIVLFLVPFMFTGGFSGIFSLINNILNTSSSFSFSYGLKVNISNFFGYLGHLTGLSLFNIISSLSVPVFAAILLSAFFLLKCNWKKVLSLSLMSVLLPGFSYMYSLIFLIPALILFFKEEKRLCANTYIYLVLMTCCFIYYPFNFLKITPFLATGLSGHGLYEVTAWNLVSSICLIVMTVLLFIDGIKTIKNNKTII